MTKQIKRTVKGMAEELIRKESHDRLREAWKEANKALKIPDAGAKKEEHRDFAPEPASPRGRTVKYKPVDGHVQ